MTMDIYQRTIRADSSPPQATDAFHESATAVAVAKKCHQQKAAAKRSFDVAFLMAPDDLSRRRRECAVVADAGYKKARFSPPNPALSLSLPVPMPLPLPLPMPMPPSPSPAASAVDTRLLSALPFAATVAAAPPQQPFQRSPLSLTVQPASPPRDGRTSGAGSRSPPPRAADHVLRSAFTKVANSSACVHATAAAVGVGEPFSRTPPVARSPSSASSTASNRSGLSPDLLAYQDSLSPQPFVPCHSPVHPLPAKQHQHAHQYQPTATPPFSKKETDRCTSPRVCVATTTTGANFHLLISNGVSRDTQECASSGALLDAERASGFEEARPKKTCGRYALLKHGLPYHHHHHNHHHHQQLHRHQHQQHAENGAPYPAFPVAAGFPFPTTLAPAAAAAAALGAALLPSSLAAFTLPAQNVCAKCNMHFRMTSDLVYHMRSQHKNEHAVVDAYKRRRDQDKLKCPVCRESFRERHHLTRHMTAHQDKEEEEEEAEEAEAAASANQLVDVVQLHRRPPAPIPGSATAK